MTKKQFRIGELAKRLQVKRFVIRFWEKEFELSPSRCSGTQRFYDEKDYEKFNTIKQLLYQEKFTISGAKKKLMGEKKRITNIPAVVAEKVSADEHVITKTDTHAIPKIDIQMDNLTSQMIQLREKLIKLNELL